MKTMTLKKFLFLLCCWGVSSHGFGGKQTIDIDKNFFDSPRAALMACSVSVTMDAIKSLTKELDDNKLEIALKAFIKQHPIGPNLKSLLRSKDPMKRNLLFAILYASVKNPKGDPQSQAVQEWNQQVFGFEPYDM